MIASTTQPGRDLLEAAGASAGVRVDGAELIRDGVNILYRLPGGVVARIGRPGTLSNARHEIVVARWLEAVGVPSIRAIGGVEQPTVVGEQPITWWHLLPEHRPATPAELGSALRRLHSVPEPDHPRLPPLNPFASWAHRVATVRSLTDDERSWLAGHMDRLRQEYADLPAGLPRCVVHGDAWQGNVAVPERGSPILLDLETVGLGRPEWDLVPLAVDHTDFGRIEADGYRSFVDAYGGYDVTAWPGYRTLATIRETRWLCFVLSKADTNEAALREARHRIACLRGEVPRPWTWSPF